MFLVFDTETHDLPADWRAPVSDLTNWPRIVQLAWLRFDLRGQLVENEVKIVRPVGFSIAQEAIDIHGITTARARREGVALHDVLTSFAASASRAKIVVAHNIDFDATVLSAEFLRARSPDPLGALAKRCTMKDATAFCNLPGSRGPKWPKLKELYFKLFGRYPDREHDALADAAACAECFFELRRRRVPPFASDGRQTREVQS